jgi:hypothetical protein
MAKSILTTLADVDDELTGKLPRSLKQDAQQMSKPEVRALVDQYYVQQRQRIAGEGRMRAFIQEKDEGPTITEWLLERFRVGEDAAKGAITAWAKHQGDPTAWALAQYGIGPILAAGFASQIDIEKAPTAGHIWAFAGLDPNQKWEKGQKRPFNGSLKVLCWKAGASFVMFHGREACFYGQKYSERKEYEEKRNESGGMAQTATETLASKNFGDSGTKNCYLGLGEKCQHFDPALDFPHLPPGRIDMRARRWAVKLFLAHWHDVAYRAHYDTAPPLPYPIAHMGHTHLIEPPAGKPAK